MRKAGEFEEIITPFKRVVNILKQAKEKYGIIDFGQFNPELIQTDVEKRLWREYQKMKVRMNELVSLKRYPSILKELKRMKGVVDEYFNAVLVMEKKENLRNNHLALLNSISEFFSPVADFSKIAGEPSKKKI